MESVERPERGRRKLAFGLSVNHGEVNGSGEGTVSSEPGMGGFLEQTDLNWTFQ